MRLFTLVCLAALSATSGLACANPSTEPSGDVQIVSQKSTLVLQHPLGGRGNLIVLLTEYHYMDGSNDAGYYYILVLPGGNGIEDKGTEGPIGIGNGSERLLDAYLPPHEGVITVWCNDKANSYYAHLGVLSGVGSDSALIDLPEGSVNPKKPLAANITGSLAKHDVTVTLSDDKRQWKFVFDEVHRRWKQLKASSGTTNQSP